MGSPHVGWDDDLEEAKIHGVMLSAKPNEGVICTVPLCDGSSGRIGLKAAKLVQSWTEMVVRCFSLLCPVRLLCLHQPQKQASRSQRDSSLRLIPPDEDKCQEIQAQAYSQSLLAEGESQEIPACQRSLPSYKSRLEDESQAYCHSLLVKTEIQVFPLSLLIETKVPVNHLSHHAEGASQACLQRLLAHGKIQVIHESLLVVTEIQACACILLSKLRFKSILKSSRRKGFKPAAWIILSTQTFKPTSQILLLKA